MDNEIFPQLFLYLFLLLQWYKCMRPIQTHMKSQVPSRVSFVFSAVVWCKSLPCVWLFSFLKLSWDEISRTLFLMPWYLKTKYFLMSDYALRNIVQEVCMLLSIKVIKENKTYNKMVHSVFRGIWKTCLLTFVIHKTIISY